MGIVGFKRILRFQEQYRNLNLAEFEYVEKDNYIEFKTDLLKEFHNYYFDYFLDRYDMAKLQTNQLNMWVNLCKKDDKLKDFIKYIKSIVKSNNEKIKKIDENIYATADSIFKQLSNIKKQEQLEELEKLIADYKEILHIGVINKKITLNKFKSIMSNTFYGQVSYLNVIHTSKDINEQKQIMFKDYIRPIIEISEIKDQIQKNNYEGLKSGIQLKLDDNTMPKNIGKIYNTLVKKYINKDKKLDDIKNYLDGEEFILCQMCSEYKSFGNEYGEGDFIPLAVSADNSRNMFWNFNTKIPLCDVCKLVLFCTAAGATDIYKGYMNDNLDSKDKQYAAFVNMDTSIKDLYKINENFNEKKDKENPFKDLIFDIISEASKRSIWQLQNTLYIEFNSDYGSKNSKMNYFNIPKFIAVFFKEKSDVLNSIKDERFKAELVDNILTNKDVKYAIENKIRKIITEGFGNPYDCFKASVIRYYLNNSRGGNKNMRYEVNDKTLKFIYMRGVELNKYYTESGSENKITSVAYRLLNSVKSNNKKEFMDTLIRIHVSAQKDVPAVFLNIMSEKEIAFEEIAHSFISGLISKALPKKDTLENSNVN